MDIKSEIKAVSVIVMNGGIVDSIRTFTDGNEAEFIFKEVIRNRDNTVSEADIETHLEDGYFDLGSFNVVIVHSFVDGTTLEN